jgi:hypothetical protein
LFEIPGSIGWFRTVLARLGAIFTENSKSDEEQALLDTWYRTEAVFCLRIKSSTWLPLDGSPLYSLDGVLTVEEEEGFNVGLHILMENTGQSQHLSIVREANPAGDTRGV